MMRWLVSLAAAREFPLKVAAVRRAAAEELQSSFGINRLCKPVATDADAAGWMAKIYTA